MMNLHAYFHLLLSLREPIWMLQPRSQVNQDICLQRQQFLSYIHPPVSIPCNNMTSRNRNFQYRISHPTHVTDLSSTDPELSNRDVRNTIMERDRNELSNIGGSNYDSLFVRTVAFPVQVAYWIKEVIAPCGTSVPCQLWPVVWRHGRGVLLTGGDPCMTGCLECPLASPVFAQSWSQTAILTEPGTRLRHSWAAVTDHGVYVF